MRKSFYCCVLSNPSGSESHTRARKSKQAAREQGHHHEGIWGTAAYFFSFSFFKSSHWSKSVRPHVVWLCPSQPDDLIFLRINLCVDTLTIKELNLRWKSEAGIVENIESVVEEYRNTRQLLVSPHSLSSSTQQLFLSSLAKPNWQMLQMWNLFFFVTIELLFKNAHCNILVFIFLF